MLNNKKGIATMYLVVGGIVIVLIILLLYSKGALASKEMTSLTPKVAGCANEKLPVSIKGTVFVKDVAYFGVTAEPEKVTIEEVKSSGVKLGAFSEDFTWTIKLTDLTSNNEVARDSGKGSHPGGSKLVEDVYRLGFFMDDNDCNGFVDDFEGTLEYNVRSDNGHDITITKPVSFKNGRYIK